jgi:hypothetical protein
MSRDMSSLCHCHHHRERKGKDDSWGDTNRVISDANRFYCKLSPDRLPYREAIFCTVKYNAQADTLGTGLALINSKVCFVLQNSDDQRPNTIAGCCNRYSEPIRRSQLGFRYYECLSLCYRLNPEPNLGGSAELRILIDPQQTCL